MSSFASESLRVLRRMIRGKAAPAPHAGRLQLLDGVSAVAAVEARVCDVAGLGASYPAALAARVWGGHETGLKLNALNAPITGVDTDSPRAAFAAAMGAAMAGRRATVFLSGPDALQCRDLLAEAAGRHLPLVVHLVLRAGAGHAQALGTGHEAYHALEGVGALRFLAAETFVLTCPCIWNMPIPSDAFGVALPEWILSTRTRLTPGTSARVVSFQIRPRRTRVPPRDRSSFT